MYSKELLICFKEPMEVSGEKEEDENAVTEEAILDDVEQNSEKSCDALTSSDTGKHFSWTFKQKFECLFVKYTAKYETEACYWWFHFFCFWEVYFIASRIQWLHANGQWFSDLGHQIITK